LMTRSAHQSHCNLQTWSE